MQVYLGADHRGFELKEYVKGWLKEEGYEVMDMGAYEYEQSDDYPDYGVKVAKGVAGEEKARGILFCGSGHGMDIVANRYKEVRSIVGFNSEVIVQGRRHEDANVLSVPTDWVDEEEVLEWVKLFLRSEFSGEVRHKRRIDKLGRLGD